LLPESEDKKNRFCCVLDEDKRNTTVRFFGKELI